MNVSSVTTILSDPYAFSRYRDSGAESDTEALSQDSVASQGEAEVSVPNSGGKEAAIPFPDPFGFLSPSRSKSHLSANLPTPERWVLLSAGADGRIRGEWTKAEKAKEGEGAIYAIQKFEYDSDQKGLIKVRGKRLDGATTNSVRNRFYQHESYMNHPEKHSNLLYQEIYDDTHSGERVEWRVGVECVVPEGEDFAKYEKAFIVGKDLVANGMNQNTGGGGSRGMRKRAEESDSDDSAEKSDVPESPSSINPNLETPKKWYPYKKDADGVIRVQWTPSASVKEGSGSVYAIQKQEYDQRKKKWVHLEGQRKEGMTGQTLKRRFTSMQSQINNTPTRSASDQSLPVVIRQDVEADPKAKKMRWVVGRETFVSKGKDLGKLEDKYIQGKNTKKNGLNQRGGGGGGRVRRLA